jgi:hypothetical protein
VTGTGAVGIVRALSEMGVNRKNKQNNYIIAGEFHDQGALNRMLLN